MQLRGEDLIKTSSMLMEEYRNYRSPKNKILRLASSGKLIPIVRGLYETSSDIPGYVLAASIYNPSYLSFEYALSVHGLIPEKVFVYTSATFDKKKRKTYENHFGTFTYQDVPKEVFPLDIKIETEGTYTFLIATAEKALCDLLYKTSPVRNQKELLALIFDDLRIDEEAFDKLDKQKIMLLSEKYHSTNLKLLTRIIEKL